MPCYQIAPSASIDFEIKKRNDVSSLLSKPVKKTGKYSIVTEEGIFLNFGADFQFFITSDGKTIYVAAKDSGLLRNYLLGPVIAALCHQRGDLVLHGSCVQIKDKTIAFLGTSTAGKSTLAGAFNKYGGEVIADDHVVISDVKHAMVKRSGIQRMKLGAKALSTFGFSPHKFEKITGTDKRNFPVNTLKGGDGPLPLSTIFILKKGEKVKVERMRGKESIIQLINQTFTRNILFGQQQTKNFEQCSELVKRVPILALYRSDSLASIQAIIDIVKEKA